MKQLIEKWWAHNLLFAFALVYSILMMVASLLPTRDFPNVKIQWADKYVHATLHFILIILWLVVVSAKSSKSIKALNIWLVFISCAVFGILIEVCQELFTQSREADLYDVIANLVGSIIGIIFFSLLTKHLKL